MATVGELAELLPHLDSLLAHELNGWDVAVSRGLGELQVKVLILEVAVLLDILGGGGIEDLLNARPIASTHAHWARLAARVQHAALQMRSTEVLRCIPDGANLTVPEARQSRMLGNDNFQSYRAACI